MNDQIGNHRREAHSEVPALRLVETSPPRLATTVFGQWVRRFWLGIVMVPLCALCLLGLIYAGMHAKRGEIDSPTTAQAKDISMQLRSLRQSDLIQFSDGRIWYVRNVQGDNLEVVGWIGDNSRIQDVSSFVLSGNQFRIIRKTDPTWALTRDKYFMQ
jgi:hypothetical protein